MASLKPIFSNALFHSRIPSSTYGRYSIGHGVLDVPDDLLLGGESLAWGLAFSSRQRLIMRTKLVSGSLMPKSLVALRKWPTRSSAIAGMIAGVRGLHQAVVDHHRDAAVVGNAVVRPP